MRSNRETLWDFFRAIETLYGMLLAIQYSTGGILEGSKLELRHRVRTLQGQ